MDAHRDAHELAGDVAPEGEESVREHAIQKSGNITLHQNTGAGCRVPLPRPPAEEAPRPESESLMPGTKPNWCGLLYRCELHARSLVEVKHLGNDRLQAVLEVGKGDVGVEPLKIQRDSNFSWIAEGITAGTIWLPYYLFIVHFI